MKLEKSEVVLMHQPPLSAKFGLHCGHFAQLPTVSEYLHAGSTLQLKKNIFIIEIQKELELLAQKNAELVIITPTVGFTDPALDYALEPLFALPFCINGFVANEANPGISRAKVIATDLFGSEYPLLADPAGQIDYKLIQSKIGENTLLFTTLKQIAYVYSACQILRGQGLEKLPTQGSCQTLEMLIHPEKHFAITIQVKLQDKILSQREIVYHPTQPSQIEAEARASWEGTPEQGFLQIDFKAQPPQALKNFYRYRLAFDIPMQEGMQYHGENLLDMQGEAHKKLRLIQHVGLSEKVLHLLVTCILPEKTFTQRLLMSQQKSFAWQNSVFNRYHESPSMISTLYQHLLSHILDQSVPLFSLKYYFVSQSEILNNMEKVDSAQLDRHDAMIFNQLLTEISEVTQTLDDFIDQVDQLLSMRGQNIEATVILETSGKEFETKEAPITVYLQGESSAGEKAPLVSTQASFQVYSTKHLPHQIALTANHEKRFNDAGSTYHISLSPLKKGAEVIEGFDWRANDKINLTDLLHALGETSGSATVVHAKMTVSGDTEIWVEQRTEDASPMRYHVLTLKGVSAKSGNLPQDLNSYIETNRR